MSCSKPQCRLQREDYLFPGVVVGMVIALVEFEAGASLFRAALTQCHDWGGLDGNVFSHSPGAPEAEIKVSAEPCSPLDL